MSNLIVPPAAGQLWLPGQGFVPPHIRQAMQAVEEYDVDLSLGRDERTGDWVVLLARGPEGRPFPVFNLGVELPTPEGIKQKLHKADVRRRGPQIVADIERHNADRRRESWDEAHDAGGEVAESIDWAMRKLGKHPNPRIFVPSGKGE